MQFDPSIGVRLPDAVTVNSEHAQEVARGLLELDQRANAVGVRLFVSHDFAALVSLNERETALGNWYPLFPIFDPKRAQMTADNAYWICGFDRNDEPVVAQAGRLFHWAHSDMASEMGELLYPGEVSHPPYAVTTERAARVAGTVCFSGSTWFHPSMRRKGLSRLLPRASRLYAFSRWNTDWTVSLVKRDLVDIGIAEAYGYTDVSYGVRAPSHPLGDLDLALVRMPRLQLVDDMRTYLMPAAKTGGSDRIDRGRDVA